MFVKITKSSSWGTISYATSFGPSRPSVQLRDWLHARIEARVKVRWGNGIETLEKLVSRASLAFVDDCGHTTTVHAEMWYFDVELYGTNVLVPIEKLDVDIDSDWSF